MQCVKEGISANLAADTHGVPRSTLKGRLNCRVTHEVNPGPQPYLTKTVETDFASQLLTASCNGYGKNRRHVWCLVEAYLKKKCTLRGIVIRMGGRRRI